MRIDKDSGILYAEEGKMLRRKSDNWEAGSEISLGYTYYIGGKKLDVPHLEAPEDYEEVDNPDYEGELEEAIIIEETPLVEEDVEEATIEEEPIVEVKDPNKVSIKEYREMESTVQRLTAELAELKSLLTKQK